MSTASNAQQQHHAHDDSLFITQHAPRNPLFSGASQQKGANQAGLYQQGQENARGNL